MIPNQAAAVDAPIASQFHLVQYWRRATAQRRYLLPGERDYE